MLNSSDFILLFETVSHVTFAYDSAKIICCVASSYGWFKSATSHLPNTLPMGLSSKGNIYSVYISSDGEWTGVSFTEGRI